MEALKTYLRLGGKDLLIGLFAAAVIYLLLVLRPWKKQARDKKRELRWFLTLWYGCTLLLVVFAGRGLNRLPPFTALWLHPFDALRKALVSPDSHAWSQLMLNVLAFVPLGLLLVWHAQGRKKGLRLCWLVLLLPLGVELIQFATGLGMFDADDLIANTLGGGWGLCLGLCYVNCKSHKKGPLWGLLAALPPLLFVLGAALWLARPYGFIAQDFAEASLPRPQTVSVDSLDGLTPASVSVYRLRRPERSEAAPTADRLFAALGLTRRAELQDSYDDFCVYWAEGSNVYTWVYYSGDFDLMIPNGLPADGAAADTVLRLLDAAGYALPAPSAAEDGRIVWDFVGTDGQIFDGEIRFRLSDGAVQRIEYRLHELIPAMERPAFDAGAVREQLLRGRFSLSEGSPGSSLVCDSLSLVYAPDSKGFYRPLYAIACRIDGAEAALLTPAC